MFYSTLKMDVNKATPVVKCSHPEAAKMAAGFIKQHEVIALPTDTIYGLACSANSPEAIKKLYEIKGRDEAKPVAICVSTLEQVRLWGHAQHLPNKLLGNLLPGPVTIVLEKTPMLNNPYLNPHTTKIGIRIPDYKFIQSVAAISGIPIALTSANLSNEPSSLSVIEFECMYSKLGAVFDGGLLGKGKQDERAGSTVVDLSKVGFYTILRDGVAYERTKKLLESFSIYRDSF